MKQERQKPLPCKECRGVWVLSRRWSGRSCLSERLFWLLGGEQVSRRQDSSWGIPRWPQKSRRNLTSAGTGRHGGPSLWLERPGGTPGPRGGKEERVCVAGSEACRFISPSPGLVRSKGNPANSVFFCLQGPRHSNDNRNT